jgi:tRNA A37 methylthiotransferase MiaB
MFEAMRLAGCREVCFGIESADPNVLKMLDKSATVNDNERAIRDAKSAGLVVRLLMMTGCPGETVRTTQLNIGFLEKMDPWYDTVAITNFTPIPGTKVADDPDSVDCEILDCDIDKYNLCLWKSENEMNDWMNLIRPRGMSVEQLSSSKRDMVNWLVNSGKINKG